MADKNRVQTTSTTTDQIKQLGEYLIEAGLLTPAQLQVALNDQTMSDMRFGEILAARGWVKQQTIEYLMEKIVLPERKAVRRDSKQEMQASNLKNISVRQGNPKVSETVTARSREVKPLSERKATSARGIQNNNSEPIIQISRTQGSVSILKSVSLHPKTDLTDLGETDTNEENTTTKDSQVNWIG